MAVNPLKIFLFLLGGSAAAGATAYVSGALDPYISPPSAVVNLPGPAPSDPAAPKDERLPGAGEEPPPMMALTPPVEETVPPPNTMAATPPPDTTAPPPAAGPQPPTFDVVRVEPDGSVVVAGKAMPDALVELLDGEKVLGSDRSTPEGDFAIVLDEKLKPGEYQLTLRATPAGGAAVASLETAVLSIPGTPDGQVLAMVEQPGQPSEILTVPQPEPPKTDEAAAPPAEEEKPADVASAPAEPPKTEEAATPPVEEQKPADVASAPEQTAPPANAPKTEEAAAPPADEQKPADVASAPAEAAPPVDAPKTEEAAAPPADEPKPADEASAPAETTPPANPPKTEEAAAPPAEEQKPAEVASAPDQTTPPAETTPAPAEPKVAVEAVEIEGSKIFVAGTGDPGRFVRVYANEIVLGETRVGEGGRFLVEAERDLPVGEYIIRADLLDGAKVIARAAVPFEREPGEAIAAVAPAIEQPADAGKPADTAAGTDQSNPPADTQTPPAEAAAPQPEQPAVAAGETTPPADAVPQPEPPAVASENTPPAEGTDAGAAPPADAAADTPPATTEPAQTAPAIAATEPEQPPAESAPAATSPAEPPAEPSAPATDQAAQPPATQDAATTPPEGGADVVAAPPETVSPKLQKVQGAVIIRRSDTLWRISRRVYGKGIRYWTIYLANQKQISDPDRIWPGQVFSVPEKSREGEAADMSAMGSQMTTTPATE